MSMVETAPSKIQVRRHQARFVTTISGQRTNGITGGIEGCVAVTHDKNLHIAPLLLTRFARFLSSETRERKRWPALCLIGQRLFQRF